MKKILIALLVLAALSAVTLNLLSRKAPEFLRESIERALNKKVMIQSIEYQFPWVFELRGFQIQEKDPFEGEESFVVDQVHLEVSPLSLSSKKLVLNKVQVENANIVIRKYRGKLYGVLKIYF